MSIWKLLYISLGRDGKGSCDNRAAVTLCIGSVLLKGEKDLFCCWIRLALKIISVTYSWLLKAILDIKWCKAMGELSFSSHKWNKCGTERPTHIYDYTFTLFQLYERLPNTLEEFVHPNQNEMEIKNKRSQEFCHMQLGGQTLIPCLQPQWGRIAAGWHKGKLFVNLAFLRECLLRQVWLTLAELCLDIYNYKKLMRLQYN